MIRTFQFSLGPFVVYLLDIPSEPGFLRRTLTVGRRHVLCIGFTTVTIFWVQRILAFGGSGENKGFWAIHG